MPVAIGIVHIGDGGAVAPRLEKRIERNKDQLELPLVGGRSSRTDLRAWSGHVEIRNGVLAVRRRTRPRPRRKEAISLGSAASR